MALYVRHSKKQIQQMLREIEARQKELEAEHTRRRAELSKQRHEANTKITELQNNVEPADVIERARFRVNKLAIIEQLQVESRRLKHLLVDEDKTYRRQMKHLQKTHNDLANFL